MPGKACSSGLRAGRGEALERGQALSPRCRGTEQKTTSARARGGALKALRACSGPAAGRGETPALQDPCQARPPLLQGLPRLSQQPRRCSSSLRPFGLAPSWGAVQRPAASWACRTLGPLGVRGCSSPSAAGGLYPAVRRRALLYHQPLAARLRAPGPGTGGRSELLPVVSSSGCPGVGGRSWSGWGSSPEVRGPVLAQGDRLVGLPPSWTTLQPWHSGHTSSLGLLCSGGTALAWGLCSAYPAWGRARTGHDPADPCPPCVDRGPWRCCVHLLSGASSGCGGNAGARSQQPSALALGTGCRLADPLRPSGAGHCLQTPLTLAHAAFRAVVCGCQRGSSWFPSSSSRGRAQSWGKSGCWAPVSWPGWGEVPRPHWGGHYK